MWHVLVFFCEGPSERASEHLRWVLCVSVIDIPMLSFYFLLLMCVGDVVGVENRDQCMMILPCIVLLVFFSSSFFS